MKQIVTLILLTMLTFAGCQPVADTDAEAPVAITVTPSPIRAARRAYSGAPPVIPHPPLGASCIQCHTETGQAAPPIGFAPANPHLKTPGIGKSANCRQCHLFRRTEETDLFDRNLFVGYQPATTKGDRLYSTAPPVIPHGRFMRESCVSCHSGPAARPEICCAHSERANCHQCHVASPEDHRSTSLSFAR